MIVSRVRELLQQSTNGLLLAGMLVLMLGMRIYAGVRCLAEIPQGDDGSMVVWLQKWSEGLHDWSFIWRFHNRVHPTSFYYLAELANFKLNGFWDARFGFLISALVHTIYGGLALWTFGRLFPQRDRRWIYPFIFILFALPFAGYRIAWGMIWQNSAPMLFALPAIYLVARRGQDWKAVAAIALLSALAALNTGAGCFCALAILGLTLFNAAMARKITSRDLVLSGVCLVIFLAIYLNMVSDKHGIGLGEAVSALFKALSWPAVFVPGAGLFTLIPLAALVIAQWLHPQFRREDVTFVTGVSGLTVLIAIATGALRGDNNNMGMPSGRYVDFFLILPLVTAVSLCLLYRGSQGRWRTVWALFGCAWIGCQVLGFSMQTVYRVIPFMAQETGEWNEAQKQTVFREAVRGHIPVPTSSMNDDETLGLPKELLDNLNEHKAPLAMTTAMAVGFDLEPGSQGNYLLGGYHPSYMGRPARLYRGSFDSADWLAADKSFTSGSFQAHAPYINLDVIVDKKARFTNYKLEGQQLALVDETSGERTELLPKLARTFPFVLRDWEMIYAKVTPGHKYRLEARDTSASQWLAFSEPFESGRLTPLLLGLCQSGKLLCLAGLGLMVLAFYVRWLNTSMDDQHEPASSVGNIN